MPDNTAAARQARRRDKLRAAGVVTVTVIVPEKYAALVRRFAARLMQKG